MIQVLLQSLLNVFRFHKKKIAFFFAALTICLLSFFPFDDLSDFISLQIARATQNNVYLQFDGLSFTLMPQPGILMDDVVVESIYSPTLAVQSVGFSPSIMSLLSGQMGGLLKVYGLFRGDAKVEFGSSNQLKIDRPEVGLTVSYENLRLEELSKFLKESQQFPVNLSGTTQLQTSLYIDPKFSAQPKGDIEISIKSFELPATQIPLQMSLTFPVPAIKLSEVKLVGNLKDRRFLIKEGQFGKVGNDLHGTITGDFIIDILPNGQMKMGGYDLNIDLNLSDSMTSQLGAILGFVDGYQSIGTRYKSVSLNGVRYRFKLQTANIQTMPQVKPL